MPAKSSIFDIKLSVIFGKVQTKVLGIVRQARGQTDTTSVYREQIVPIFEALHANVRKWAGYRVPEEYLRGHQTTNGMDTDPELDDILSGLEAIGSIDQAQPSLDRLIVERLADPDFEPIQVRISEAVQANLARLNQSLGNIRLAFASETREEVVKILTDLNTLTDFQKKQTLAEIFRGRGYTYFVDRSGRKRTIERYAETLVRTETQNAYLTGSINNAIQQGYTKLKRLEAIDCCPDICEPRRGEIRDITTQGNPYLTLHPNCRGQWEWLR